MLNAFSFLDANILVHYGLIGLAAKRKYHGKLDLKIKIQTYKIFPYCYQLLLVLIS